MKLKTSNLTENFAKEICKWTYPSVYSIYNYPEWNQIVNDKWAITIKEKRLSQFLAILDCNNNLCGYGRFIENTTSVCLGLGLKPCLCNKKLGTSLIQLLILECKKRYPNKDIILEVRAFNIRAIKCYEKNGFIKVDYYKKNTLLGSDYFFKMKYRLL